MLAAVNHGNSWDEDSADMNDNCILETEAFEENYDDYLARLESRGNQSAERQVEACETPRQERRAREDDEEPFAMTMNQKS